MSCDFLLNRKQVEWAYRKWAYYTLEEISDALFVSKHCLEDAFRRYGYGKKPPRKKLEYGVFDE